MLETEWAGIGRVSALSSVDGSVVWASPDMFYGGSVDVGDLDGDRRLDIVVTDDPAGADAQIPEPFRVFLTDAGFPLSLSEETGTDFVAESDTTRLEIVDLAERP